tara:strand:+ start:124 stop:969 length:846 start_codon:yes stop_codon:yes gene_type:complete
MANITVSDSLRNFVPRGPKLIRVKGKKLLTWAAIEEFQQRKKEKGYAVQVGDISGSTGMQGDGMNIFEPYQLSRWDFHRALVRDFKKVKDNQKAFEKWVPEFAECCGDLFYDWPAAGHLGLGSLLEDWFAELEILESAIEAIDSGKGKTLKDPKVLATSIAKTKITGPPVLSQQLKRFTYPDLNFKHQKRSKESVLALGAESLIGFCWLLVAREIEMGIKYVECRSFSIPHKDAHSGLQVDGCGRWVPNINPKGNPMTVCSKGCSTRADRAAKKAAKKPAK